MIRVNTPFQWSEPKLWITYILFLNMAIQTTKLETNDIHDIIIKIVNTFPILEIYIFNQFLVQEIAKILKGNPGLH